MRHKIALALAAALFAAPVRADVVPPPEQVTPIQARMIGTWQQTEQVQMRDHGQGRATLLFDKTRYVKALVHVIGATDSSSTYVESGTWTGKELGTDAYEITLTPDGGAALPLNVTFAGDKTMTMQLWPHNTYMVAPFSKVFP